MPRRAMRLDLRRMSSCPSRVIEPLRFAKSPMIERMVVVLPAPLRPKSVTTSPALTSKVIPCRTWLSPYQACTSRTASCTSAMTRPHVRFNHLGVIGNLGVGPFSQNLAACQYRNPVRQIGDDGEVMLHHQYGAILGHPADERRGALDVFRSHTGHRF